MLRPPFAARLALIFALAHCGARTGLGVPALDASAVDAVTDGSLDVEVAPPECTADRDCDDGIDCTRDRCVAARCVHTGDDTRCDDRRLCNGPERCVVGAGCASGAPPTCDDGVACTRDRCDDAMNRCATVTDDGLCPLSYRCDAMRGCVARALANAASGLYDVDLPSGAMHYIGPIRAFTDVALHPDRTLYAVTAGGDFARVDPSTGDSVSLASTGVPFTALDAAPDGTLFAAGSRGLFHVDARGGGAELMATFPPGLEASGDIAFLEGRLLATARTGPGAIDVLVEFDRAAGTSRVLGSVGYTCVWALAAFGPTLYGLTCEGRVLSIDARTGAGRQTTRGAVLFYGATAR